MTSSLPTGLLGRPTVLSVQLSGVTSCLGCVIFRGLLLSLSGSTLRNILFIFGVDLSESEGYVCGLIWYPLEYVVMVTWLVLSLILAKMEINLTTSVFTVIMYFK